MKTAIASLKSMMKYWFAGATARPRDERNFLMSDWHEGYLNHAADIDARWYFERRPRPF